MVWLQSGIWVEMIPPVSRSSALGTHVPWEQAGAAWDAGSWAPGLTGTPASLLSFSVPSFYFPIPEKKEPCLQGEAEMKASKLFGK